MTSKKPIHTVQTELFCYIIYSTHTRCVWVFFFFLSVRFLMCTCNVHSLCAHTAHEIAVRFTYRECKCVRRSCTQLFIFISFLHILHICLLIIIQCGMGRDDETRMRRKRDGYHMINTKWSPMEILFAWCMHTSNTPLTSLVMFIYFLLFLLNLRHISSYAHRAQCTLWIYLWWWRDKYGWSACSTNGMNAIRRRHTEHTHTAHDQIQNK